MARPSSYGAANRPVMADRTGCRVFLVRKRARQRLLGKEKPLGSSPDPRDGWRASKDLCRHAPRVCCVQRVLSTTWSAQVARLSPVH